MLSMLANLISGDFFPVTKIHYPRPSSLCIFFKDKSPEARALAPKCLLVCQHLLGITMISDIQQFNLGNHSTFPSQVLWYLERFLKRLWTMKRLLRFVSCLVGDSNQNWQLIFVIHRKHQKSCD